MFALGRFALIWCTTRISSATRSALLTFQTFWGLPVTSTRLQASRRPSTQRKQRSTTTVRLIKTEKEREGGGRGIVWREEALTHTRTFTHTHTFTQTHTQTHTHTHPLTPSFVHLQQDPTARSTRLASCLLALPCKCLNSHTTDKSSFSKHTNRYF